MKMMFLAATAALAIGAMPVAAMAKEAPVQPAAISGTALLNKQQNEKAARDNAAYEARMAAANQSVASSAEIFQTQTDAYEAEKHRVADQAADERLQWEADVKACEAGEKRRCAAPADPE